MVLTAPAMANENGAGGSAPGPQELALTALQAENALLSRKVADLETVPNINADALTAKSRQRLREIAADVKSQRQSMADFESFVTWMSTNLSGYSRYIQAGSIAAGFARALPIPYAGQASVLTKFISQGILSLNAASVSVSRYLATSREFSARVDALEHAAPAAKAKEIAELSLLADQQLRRDMNDARAKLKAASELSSSTLSFLESLNHYVGSTDEYWNKTKSLLTRKDADQKEKGYLSQSIQNLQNRAGSFNARLRNFETSTEKDESLIVSLKVYDELIRDLSTKHASIGTPAPGRP
jgi:hypothetical protein